MKKILVVDDEVEFSEAIKTFLEEEDYKVLRAKNSKECFQKIKEESPDLIILDVIMPGLDGLTVCQRIQGLEIPIIIMSGLKGEKLARTARAVGAVDFIKKPFSFTVLQEKIEKILKEH